MPRYLVLLPAPEAEWAQLPPEEHAKGMRAHERFNRELAEGGHRVVDSSPLTPSARAVSMRPDGAGGTLVTDGPFTESAEQIVGYYLIETDDRDGFLACCRQLASTGDLLEIRRLATDDHERAAGSGSEA
ncbi:MAG TPA: YciI family protein [Dermatophilaceae bacterium]|nr:YciI family protein [Dermatophilaceae bacterium]